MYQWRVCDKTHKIKEKRKKDTSSTTSTSGTHIQGPEDLLLHSETS